MTETTPTSNLLQVPPGRTVHLAPVDAPEPAPTGPHLHFAMHGGGRDVALAHLQRVRDELAAVRARWQTNAELGRLSTFAGCAADLDDVLATTEQSLRALAGTTR